MKIVVTDGYTLNPGDNPWNEVAGLGELVVFDRSAQEELLERCQGAQVIVVNKTPLRRPTLERLEALRLITVAATGYDCVDIDAAGERGVPVCNVPVYGTDSVAQYTLAALLELSLHLGLHGQAVKAGEWAAQPDWCFWKTPLTELKGKTLGVVGFGRIGRRVGELGHAFGMSILAHDPYSGPEPGYQPFAWAGLEELFGRADVVTIHSPQTPENAGFVKADLLRRMKPTALFINAARGGLVNEADLAEALNRGLIAGAALDVVSSEPIRPDNPLLQAKNLLLTPHLAWATKEARQRLMTATAENIQAFLAGKPINVVNARFLKKTD